MLRTEKAFQNQLADDAVVCEPVSGQEFPDIREKYREFAQIGSDLRTFDANSTGKFK
jgi:hypothetical protein